MKVAPEKTWSAPPPFPQQTAPFHFNTAPDLQYWLTFGIVEGTMHIANETRTLPQNEGLCPYITVHYISKEQSEQELENLAAASSAINVYNRWLLKEKSLGKTLVKPSDISTVAHYCLAFRGDEYIIYITGADISDPLEWEGCLVQRVAGSGFHQTAAVECLLDWLKKIHRWACTAYANDCAEDWKIVIALARTEPAKNRVGKALE